MIKRLHCVWMTFFAAIKDLKKARKGDLSNVAKELVKIQIAVTFSRLSREALNRLNLSPACLLRKNVMPQ